MSSIPEGGLDFDKADFGTVQAGATCSICRCGIRDTYFSINGHIACPSCRDQAALRDASAGRLGRVARATLFGMIGGAVGAAAWYAVAALFRLEVGLIAILVGWLVGAGVHKGSGGRGGRGYQVLAAFIAYASIVTTYIPEIYRGLAGSAAAPAATAGASAQTAEDGSSSMESDTERGGRGVGTDIVRGFAALILAGVVLYGVAFAAPFLGGFENIIGILIIGFALQQAWTMNARRILAIEGPFKVNTPLPAEAPPEAAAEAPPA